MNAINDLHLHHWLDRLRELPFVQEVELLVYPVDGERLADAVVRIATPGLIQDFAAHVKRTHLTRTIVDGLLAQVGPETREPWILLAIHVGRPLARYLDEHEVDYIDLAGNCRLQVGHQHLAKIEGRPFERRPAANRAIRAPGHQVLFAILARPELLDGPIRNIAHAAGVAPATAALQLTHLAEQDLILKRGRRRRLIDPRRLLDLWLKGYETVLRPRLLLGRYRTRETVPEALEHEVEATLGARVPWAFGGTAAAFRLTGHYRGAETVVHLGRHEGNLTRELGALPARDGPLVLMTAPGPVAFEGVAPWTAAPLLVYAELLVAGDKRALEAAAEIHEAYLEHLG